MILTVKNHLSLQDPIPNYLTNSRLERLFVYTRKLICEDYAKQKKIDKANIICFIYPSFD